MQTQTAYEKRITEYAQQNLIRITRSKAQRLAMKLHKRQARMWDEDLERIFMHSDPTPKQAFRNLERSAAA
jgi:hypothetical protein